MSQKKNEIVIGLFGDKVKKEPFLIETDTSIGEKKEKNDKEAKPQVLLNSLDNTAFGKNFNKVLPELEPFLKAVFDNLEFKKKSESALTITAQHLDLHIKNKPLTQNNLQNQIEQKVKLASPKLNRA